MQTTELTSGGKSTDATAVATTASASDSSGPSAGSDVASLTAVSSLVPLFALIIGIDNYTNCQKLRGAVADAQAVKDYLEEVLRVSEDHIHTLFDEEATRKAFIRAFRDLRDDQRIRHGDPILIYYAGHGGELAAPHAWGIEGKIQCLLPCDYKHVSTQRSQLANTDPIPDRTIGALIEDIAKVKGDNITVILDCCHSASGTRLENEEFVARTVILDHTIHGDLDSGIWDGRAGKIPSGLTYHGLRSHVLLAACGEKELAYEHKGRGQFTTALLSTLKNCAVNDLSYIDLFQRIHITKQHPRCEGVNRDRRMFNARVSAGRQVRHSVHSLQGRKYVVSAGSAHGISHGVEITLYSNQKQRQEMVVVDDTAVVEDFQTTVTMPVHFGEDAFARLTRVGKLPFYLSPAGNKHLSSLLGESLGGMAGNDAYAANFQPVKNVEEAKLEVVVDGQRVAFDILDRRVNAFGLTRLPHTVTFKSVAQALNAAAHYYWYLDLTNKNSPIGTNRQVAVDFYSLMSDYDDYGQHLYIPIEPGFYRRDPNLDSDVIDFVVKPQEVYGFKITNNTPWDLYLNAFLFNNDSLSMESYYTQQSDGEQEPPLKRNGTFSIGYGPGGTPPFEYSLEEGQDVDVGYLKIFFATRPIDLSGLVRMSPFTDTEGRELEEDIARKARLSVSPLTQASSGPVDTWFTVEIPVVQRREWVEDE